jgi:transposase
MVRGRIRYVVSGEPAGGLFGGRAPAIGSGKQERKPEPSASVARCRRRRHEPDGGGRIGGMDRQTLRDWVHRFQRARSEGLLDGWSKGPAPRLSAGQRSEIAQLVETVPYREVHGVVRWRRIDLQRVIVERFGVVYHERTIGKLLKTLGFSHISARPRHPAQDQRTIEAFKKTSPPS